MFACITLASMAQLELYYVLKFVWNFRRLTNSQTNLEQKDLNTNKQTKATKQEASCYSAPDILQSDSNL